MAPRKPRQPAKGTPIPPRRSGRVTRQTRLRGHDTPSPPPKVAEQVQVQVDVDNEVTYEQFSFATPRGGQGPTGHSTPIHPIHRISLPDMDNFNFGSANSQGGKNSSKISNIKITEKVMSNKNLVSKEDLHTVLGRYWTHQKPSPSQFDKMLKTLNDQTEKLFDTLTKKNQDDYGWFDFKDLEQILQDQKLIGRDKHALVAELSSTFTPTQYRICMDFLTSKESFMAKLY